MDALDIQVGRVLGVKQDGPQVLVVRRQDLEPRELVPPPLTVAVQRAVAKDLDVLAAPFPEHDAVLEGVAEGILLPKGRVVGELDLAVELDMDVVEERQVQRLANNVGAAAGEADCATVVGTLERIEELVGDIIRVVGGRSEGDDSSPGLGVFARVWVLGSKLCDRPRHTRWEVS